MVYVVRLCRRIIPPSPAPVNDKFPRPLHIGSAALVWRLWQQTACFDACQLFAYGDNSHMVPGTTSGIVHGLEELGDQGGNRERELKPAGYTQRISQVF